MSIERFTSWSSLAAGLVAISLLPWGDASAATGRYCRDRNGRVYFRSSTPCRPGEPEVNGPNGGGASGGAGVTGPTGPAGPAGTNGAAGATGPTGATGATGAAGAAGAVGATGAAGTNGSTGATGPTGPTGAQAAGGLFHFSGSTGATSLSSNGTAPLGYAIGIPQNSATQSSVDQVAVVAGNSCSRIAYEVVLTATPGLTASWSFQLQSLTAAAYASAGLPTSIPLCTIGDPFTTCSGTLDVSISANDLLSFGATVSGTAAISRASWSVRCLAE